MTNEPHWGRRIALGAASLLAAAGVVFGVDRAMNNGDDDPERGAVTDVTPVSEPTTTPTPEATPTKEPEKSPYNFTSELKIGHTTFRIEDNLQSRSKCPDPSSASGFMVDCSGISELVWNKEKYPNLGEDMKAAEKRAFYIAWRNQDSARSDITFEEYNQKLAKGEDLSFILPGFQGEDALPSDLKINPTDEVFIDYIAQPASLFRPYTSLGISYRKINDELHMEIYKFIPNKSVRENPAVTRELSKSTMLNHSGGLMYMSNLDNLRSGSLKSSAELDKYFKTSEEIQGNLINQLDGIEVKYKN